MNRDPDYDLGPAFVPVFALLHEMEGSTLPRLPLAEAVHQLCESALERLDEIEHEGKPNDIEYHHADAFLTAIGVLTLIGGADAQLCPHGMTPANSVTPDAADALAYASLLCDLACERWPAPPASWYEKPSEDDEAEEGAR